MSISVDSEQQASIVEYGMKDTGCTYRVYSNVIADRTGQRTARKSSTGRAEVSGARSTTGRARSNLPASTMYDISRYSTISMIQPDCT